MELSASENNSALTVAQCLNVVKVMASTNGFYGRLHQQLMNNQSVYDSFADFCTRSHFPDAVAFIMAMEDGEVM